MESIDRLDYGRFTSMSMRNEESFLIGTEKGDIILISHVNGKRLRVEKAISNLCGREISEFLRETKS